MKSSILQATGWMVLFRVADRSLGLISTLLLARLLLPSDFGVVAMAMSVIAVIELFAAFSFEIALLQRPLLDREHYDTAWTLNLLLSVGCAVAVAIVAYPGASFYGEPRLALVLLALAAGWWVGGLENTGVVDFRRSMDFRREFAWLTTKRFIAFFVTALAALLFRNYWALVLGTVTGRVAGVLTSYAMHPYRPRPSLRATRELLSFSSWMLLNNAVLVAIVRFPHFLIGRLFGSAALGSFSVAYDFATLPVTELASPVNRAMLPTYAQLAENEQQLRDTFLDVGAVITAMTLPASLGVFAIAEPLVSLLLGPRWLSIAPLIKVLAISASFIALQTHNGMLLVALGTPRLNMAVSSFRLVALVPLCYAFIPHYQLLGVAYAEAIASLVCLLVSYPYVFKRLHISLHVYGSRIWRPSVASIAMGAGVSLLIGHSNVKTTVIEAVGQLVLGIAFGTSAYVVVLGVLWLLCGRPRGAETLIWARIADLAQRRRR